MKKFLLTLAVAALASSAMIAQNTTTTSQEEPDRIQMRQFSKDPTGMDIPTGCDKAQVVDQKKHECKDHKDGQPCTKPADQQCDDCKAKAAAAPKHECKKGEGHECKEGQGHECDKAMAPKHECKEGEGKKCDKAMAPKHECKDHKDGQPCTKPADQQCPDCKEAAKKK